MLRIPVRVSYRHWMPYAACLLVMVGLLWLSHGMRADAVNAGWMTGTLKGEVIGNQEYDLSAAHCRTETVEIQAGPTQEMCIYRAKSFQWAQYFEYPGTLLRTVVRFNNEQRMHLIDNFIDGSTFTTYGFLLSGSDSNDLLYNRWGTTWIVEDFPSHLRPSIEHPGRLIFDRDAIHELSVDEAGSHNDTYTGAISGNGKWMALTYRGVGIVRINLETFEVTLVTQDGLGMNFMFDMAISDDGHNVAVMGDTWHPSRMIYVDEECGIRADALLQAWKVPINMGARACQQRDIDSDLRRIYGSEGSYVYVHSPVFTGGDEELFMRVVTNNGDSQRQAIRLLSSAYNEEKLDYLALGDSYSSGEGDLVNKGESSHYLLSTEQPGRCHLSDRSYPFLLRDRYRIPDVKMKSVACSGAQVVLDYLASPSVYKGQHGELLGLDTEARKVKWQSTLEDFMPGIIPQIDFVKKYKPATITLTGGGNDVGFAGILAYCATPTWEGMFYDDTCGYAIEGSELDKILHDTIDTQYGYTKMLLAAIKAASLDTRVIIVGYPSFVSETRAGFCGDQVAALNSRERKMMNEAVNYMNSMLRRVSRDTGVTFVDIEKSLYGGRLCEGGEYMSGLADTKYYKKSSSGDKYQEAFHPNSDGHKKIAEQIIKQNAFYENSFDQETDYIVPEGMVNTIQVQDALDGGDIIRNKTSTIRLQPGTFQSSSQVVISAHSTPTNLGTYTAGNDGSLVVDIPTNSLVPGRHVLIMAGKSYGGEDVRYTQFATVRASEKDADGDGILDRDDQCTFISIWIDEVSGRDICTNETVSEHGGVLRDQKDATLAVDLVVAKTQEASEATTQSNRSGERRDENITPFGIVKQEVITQGANNIKLGLVILFVTGIGALYGIKRIAKNNKKT